MTYIPKGTKRHWTAEEESLLAESWGVCGIPALAKKLNRSQGAIKLRASRLHLGPLLMGGDYVTLNQLVTAFNRTGSYSYKMISWVENRGLPVHNKRVQQNTFRVVYLKEFWIWAEKNRSFLDFSKLEPLAFGEEPAWVAEQRKRDFKACSLQRKDPWTPAEDAKLRMLLEQYKYTYEQMSDMLRRSPGAIQRRCADLGLKARPVRINPHGPGAVWHQEDYDRLAEGIKSGESYMSISKALGKSEKAIRGKVYYCYLTENADKVRAMMAGGNWGDGAPEPTVWQARLLSRSRAEMQTTMTMLVEALNCRIQQVGYDPALEDHWNQYWQRTTCLHMFWATVEDRYIAAGQTHGDVTAECMTAGTAGNGYLAGQIATIVDVFDYYTSCTNLTESGGGSDAPTDDEFYEQLRQSEDNYSTAGPKGGYIAKAKAVSNDIADVLPNSPTPGEVRIYVLMEDGTIAGQEVKNAVLAACNADETRPLTDHVLVEDPETVEYDIDTTYYLNRGGPSAADVQSEVNAAVDAYVKWQAGKLGRDINPSELTRRMMVNGVKRVVIRSPVYTELRSGNVATDASGRVALADLTDTVPQVGKLRGRTVTSGGYEDE